MFTGTKLLSSLVVLIIGVSSEPQSDVQANMTRLLHEMHIVPEVIQTVPTNVLKVSIFFFENKNKIISELLYQTN